MGQSSAFVRDQELIGSTAVDRVDTLPSRGQEALMGGLEPPDRKTHGAKEPEAMVSDVGPHGHPETPVSTRTSEVDPGQDSVGVNLVGDRSVSGVESEEATLAYQGDTVPA